MLAGLALLALGVGLAACGASGGGAEQPAGMVVTGPGVGASKPPWRPEYAQLPRRLRKLGLPAPGSEKFHQHMQLRIYVQGLLSPVAANIGVDEPRQVESALHTHDATGVIHLEASKPFRATLGDFFYVWGVRFGPSQIGALKVDGNDRLEVFVNGGRIADPAAHALRKDDNIVIAFGSTNKFPRRPNTAALDAANGKGPRPAACSTGAQEGAQPESCLKSKD